MSQEFDYIIAYVNEKLAQESPTVRIALQAQLEPCRAAVAAALEPDKEPE